MSSPPTEILDDLVETLRGTGLFRVVSLEDDASGEIPRAVVALDGYEFLTPDDSAGKAWGRLSAGVSVRTRGLSAAETVKRAGDLCDLAMAALAQDAFRGGLCGDLPIGKATELGRARPIAGLRRPEAGMVFDVRCHFETEAGA